MISINIVIYKIIEHSYNFIIIVNNKIANDKY